MTVIDEDALPDGWEHVDGVVDCYDKLVKRGAVTVPKRFRGEPFERDAVVIVTDALAGVVKGPGARQSWQVDDPVAVGIELAETIEEWIADGGDPYGGVELDQRLEAAAASTTEQKRLATDGGVDAADATAETMPEFTGVVVNEDPLTLSDGEDEVVLPDVDGEFGLGHRLTVADGEVIDHDARDGSTRPSRPPTEEDEYGGGRIPYEERGDGQPTSTWRFAKRDERGPRP